MPYAGLVMPHVAWCGVVPRPGVAPGRLDEGRRATLVSPEPLGPEPEPTEEIVDLSGEATSVVSDLQGAAAVPEEVVLQSTPAELDLTKESPGVPPKDLTIVLEYIHVTFEALKILKLGFGVGVKKMGAAVPAAVALCMLAVAAVLLIHFARDYTGWILVGCSVIAALLILLAWLGGRGGRDD